jgi:hypothetical protein
MASCTCHAVPGSQAIPPPVEVIWIHGFIMAVKTLVLPGLFSKISTGIVFLNGGEM